MKILLIKANLRHFIR